MVSLSLIDVAVGIVGLAVTVYSVNKVVQSKYHQEYVFHCTISPNSSEVVFSLEPIPDASKIRVTGLGLSLNCGSDVCLKNVNITIGDSKSLSETVLISPTSLSTLQIRPDSEIIDWNRAIYLYAMKINIQSLVSEDFIVEIDNQEDSSIIIEGVLTFQVLKTPLSRVLCKTWFVSP